eukprot:evm.model.scf_4234.1 EVM.evm.TU.scf_4234.1   scf_4234:5006-5242(-)
MATRLCASPLAWAPCRRPTSSNARPPRPSANATPPIRASGIGGSRAPLADSRRRVVALAQQAKGGDVALEEQPSEEKLQ